MEALTTTIGIVACAAVVVAIASAVVAIVVLTKLRAVQSAQRAVIGDQGERDLVQHAEALQSEFKLTAELVEELLQRLDAHSQETKRRLDGSICHSGIVRYDAYGEMGGRQSHSIALLDDRRTGIILSAIHHRDQARLYVKQIRGGVPDIELSPEELEAIANALKPAAAASNGSKKNVATVERAVSA